MSCLGHADLHVSDAIRRQLEKVAFAHTGFFTSHPAEALADRLSALSPEGLDEVYFVSGGSEAMEAALKLARQYHLERGETARCQIIARRQSYHGNTLGALATGGNAARRAPFDPLLMGVHHVSPCYAYREQRDDETAEAYRDRLVAEIEAQILAVGPERVMAFVAEPVVGATLGAVTAVPGYFKAVREVCNRHGVLMILDEVMCGMGRTGTLFACEAEGVSPDILCIAKGLGAGYQPIGAMLCQTRIRETIAKGSGAFQHGHTYIGHPVACAAALAVVERQIDQGVLARVAPLGAQLQEALEARFGQHPNVGDIRGRGLFRGLELVADRESKTPLDPALKVHEKIKAAAFDAGLICYPGAGTADGARGNHVLLAPPFIMEETHVAELVDKLAIAFENAGLRAH